MEHTDNEGNTGEIMLQVPDSHIPHGKPASGWSSKVLDTLACIKELVPIALECVRSFPVTPGSVFTIAEYGCADGGTSMPLIYSCVEELRKLHGNELEILVYYEDQPINDFTSVFSFVQGLIPGPPSYFTAFPNVYVAVCGTQFLKQCSPRGSINLGLCCIAIHWLSKKPCDIAGGVFHDQSQNPDERELFAKQAAADWETFLLVRAKELSTGGNLALIVLAEDDDGQRTGNTKNCKVPFYRVLYEVWKSMAGDGVITMDEVNKTTVAIYARARKEIQLPFMSEGNPVREAGLQLTSLEFKTFDCPHTELRQQSGDVKMAAKSMAEETRAWSSCSFLSGLSDQRTAEEKNFIMDEFHCRLEAEFVRAPEDYKKELVAAFVVIKKLN